MRYPCALLGHVWTRTWGRNIWHPYDQCQRCREVRWPHA